MSGDLRNIPVEIYGVYRFFGFQYNGCVTGVIRMGCQIMLVRIKNGRLAIRLYHVSLAGGFDSIHSGRFVYLQHFKGSAVKATQCNE